MASCENFLYILVLVFIINLIDTSSGAPNSGKVIHRNLVPIDDEGKFQIQWEVDFETNIITFDLSVQTKGFVGFGISNGQGMTGADIIIGGLYNNGTSYFSDRHGVGNKEPVVDISQDWDLKSSQETATHTTLKVSRLLNTCDENADVAITSDTMKLIWSYGETDSVAYHSGNRGSYSINLLDPPMPPIDETDVDKWLVVANATMPTKETTYWCSIHKSPPNYTAKRHVIAFNTKLDSDIALKHTHHFVVFRCVAPTGVDPDELFGPFVGVDGGECFVPKEEQVVPVDLCNRIMYTWAVGGRMMTLPENVGFPIIEDGQSEYVMVEMHYDNPESLPGVRVESSLEIYNTLKLRPIEAGISTVMQAMTYSHIVPPKTQEYVTTGHCSSACTKDAIPIEGSNVFNVMLHSHKAGRKLRLRHIRDKVELPWISADDHYDFDFQQNRPLREVVKVMPGDHLITECVQNTMDRDNVTISGYGTMDEMCQAVFWHYPRGSFPGCQSAYNETKLLERFGIQEISWPDKMKPPTITLPVGLANMSLVEFLSTKINWTSEVIAELQEETRYNNNYQQLCGSLQNVQVGYPKLDQEYIPDDQCQPGNQTSKTSHTASNGFILSVIILLIQAL